MSNQTAGMGGMRVRALSPSASRAIMSPSGEMNPWKRHIILITKAFGLSSLANATGGTIMYFSNPIEQSAAGFVEAQPLRQYLNPLIETDTSSSPLHSPPDATLTHAVLFVLRLAQSNRACAQYEFEAKPCTCAGVRTLQLNLICYCCQQVKI